MKKYTKDRTAGHRVGDYIDCCDICGTRVFHSQTTVLDTYTGRGGLTVCPDCVDPIDYGLVPYLIPAEQPVPSTRDTMQSSNPGVLNTTTYQKYNPINIATQDPLNTTPSQCANHNTTPGYNDPNSGTIGGDSENGQSL